MAREGPESTTRTTSYSRKAPYMARRRQLKKSTVAPSKLRRLTYKKAVITFLDVLGFRDMVARQPRFEISRVLQLFQGFSAPNNAPGVRGRNEPYAMVFSDSVIRARPINTRENRSLPQGLLFHELLDLLLAQGELVAKGILVRGAVTVGDIAVERPKIFGPGFIEAYDWESQIAKYPRIVVTDAALRALGTDPLLRAAHHRVCDEQDDVFDMLSQADDGVWFIDYLRRFPEEMDSESDFLPLLEQHRDLIRNAGKTLKTVNSAAQKYVWLARYHNNVVDGLQKKWLQANGVSGASLKIESGEVPGFYDQIRRKSS